MDSCRTIIYISNRIMSNFGIQRIDAQHNKHGWWYGILYFTPWKFFWEKGFIFWIGEVGTIGKELCGDQIRWHFWISSTQICTYLSNFSFYPIIFISEIVYIISWLFRETRMEHLWGCHMDYIQNILTVYLEHQIEMNSFQVSVYGRSC